MQLSAAATHVALLDLPWSKPLESWNDPRLVRMARGNSRHLVRFVEMNGRVYAIKEIGDRTADREYRMLQAMLEEDLPVVEPIGTVTERQAPDGTPLEGALVTRYLDFSLPYSYLLARESSMDRQQRMIDAAAVLLVRLHLDGFVWGDCSLANILFRRDAGGLFAYLVDAETAEHHPPLSAHKRAWDLDVAEENFAGGMDDLIAAGWVEPNLDPVVFAERLGRRYRVLWDELTKEQEFPVTESWRLEERVNRLNELGFEVREMSITSDGEDQRMRIRPTVVEEGHHFRRLRDLTGIQVQENQARRLLNDMAAFKAKLEDIEGRPLPVALAAYRWLTDRFEPFMSAIPPELASRLEPAEAFHQYLDHKYYLSQQEGYDVPDEVALVSFIEEVLATKPEERILLPDHDSKSSEPAASGL